MAFDCIDINIDEPVPEFVEGTPNDGDGWDAPLGFLYLPAALRNRGSQDSIFVGCDPQILRDRYVGKTKYQLDNGGEFRALENLPVFLQVEFGNIGSRLETALSTDSWYFMGSRPFPFRRAGAYDGEDLFTLNADNIQFYGMKCKNVKTGVRCARNSQFIYIRDIRVENAERGIHFDNVTLVSSIIDGGVFKNIARQAIQIGTNYDCRISNITVLNNNNEDGQQAGIRVLGSSQNLLIEDVTITSSMDTWVGAEPLDPLGTQDANNSSNYTQGDGVTVESGNNVTIRRVITTFACDRIVDCKADNSLIEYCGGIASKSAITAWGDNVVVRHCSVKSPQWYGNAGTVGYQMMGDNGLLENCELFMWEDRNNQAVGLRRGDRLVIRNCKFEIPRGSLFLRAVTNNDTSRNSEDAIVVVENTVVNGVLINQTFAISPSSQGVVLPSTPYTTIASIL